MGKRIVINCAGIDAVLVLAAVAAIAFMSGAIYGAVKAVARDVGDVAQCEAATGDECAYVLMPASQAAQVGALQ